MNHQKEYNSKYYEENREKILEKSKKNYYKYWGSVLRLFSHSHPPPAKSNTLTGPHSVLSNDLIFFLVFLYLFNIYVSSSLKLI